MEYDGPMKIAVVGCSGRMGQMLIRAIDDNDGAELTGVTERPGHEWTGRDLGEAMGGAARGVAGAASASDSTLGAFGARAVGRSIRSMAWIRTVSDGEAEGFLAEQFAAARERAGRVFGIVRLMSLQPRTLEASMRMYREVMFGRARASDGGGIGGLARQQREMLAVVVSRANHCHF